jgi:hypothetical protein
MIAATADTAKGSVWTRFGIALFLAAVFSPAAWRQLDTGVISCLVRDRGCARVPSAAVTVLNHELICKVIFVEVAIGHRAA